MIESQAKKLHLQIHSRFGLRRATEVRLFAKRGDKTDDASLAIITELAP
jgi:hypothetical protein